MRSRNFALTGILITCITLAGAMVGSSHASAGEGPDEATMSEIVNWLSTTFDLPMTRELPRVEIVPQMKIAALRYREPGLDRTSQAAAGESPDAPLAVGNDVVAIYDNAHGTIYLPEGWTGATPAEISVLVHEMVHHLQNVGKIKYECPAAREKPAYLAQDRWLKRFGLDLEGEFQVDLFTVVIRSACMY